MVKLVCIIYFHHYQLVNIIFVPSYLKIFFLSYYLSFKCKNHDLVVCMKSRLKLNENKIQSKKNKNKSNQKIAYLMSILIIVQFLL